MDDLIVTKTDQGYLYVVSNAGCADKDSAHMKVNTDSVCVCVCVDGQVGSLKEWYKVSDKCVCVCVCVCFTFRQNLQSSKLQVLMWIWSSLMKRWLLCKVKHSSSCFLFPPLSSFFPPIFSSCLLSPSWFPPFNSKYFSVWFFPQFFFHYLSFFCSFLPLPQFLIILYFCCVLFHSFFHQCFFLCFSH